MVTMYGIYYMGDMYLVYEEIRWLWLLVYGFLISTRFMLHIRLGINGDPFWMNAKRGLRARKLRHLKTSLTVC